MCDNFNTETGKLGNINKRNVKSTASVITALIMEAVSNSETSVNFYHTIRLYISEGSHLPHDEMIPSLNYRHFGHVYEFVS
jgi:hypothetical protein